MGSTEHKRLPQEGMRVRLQMCWSQVRRWVSLGTEWVERMWLRDERRAGKQGAGEHRWTWIWLGQDAADTDIDDLVQQVQEEVQRLPAPLGIGEFMITVSAWGPRCDGVGETVFLAAKQAGDDVGMQEDLALRDRPRVVAIGDLARGHIIDRHGWHSGAREQLRRTLRLYRPSRNWRIVTVSLFSVGEAYLKLVTRPAMSTS